MRYSRLSTQPKNISCKNEEWGLFNMGPDDFGKECFCKIDSNICVGVESCRKNNPEKWVDEE